MKKPLLSELTIREKVGQTVSLSPALVNMAEDIDEYLKNNPFGSMWVAGHQNMDFINVAGESSGNNLDYDLDIGFREFAAKASAYCKAPLLLSLDAETGLNQTYPYYSMVPSSNAIGATGDPECAYKVGKAVGHELKTAGVRWVWGPVADNPCPLASIFLLRAYSSDVKLASEMVSAYVKGVQSENVAAGAKHFPGADRYDYRDSHFSDQCITQSYEEWFERQGKIFQAAIDAGTMTIMTSHGSFPAVDDTILNGRYIPTTLSRKILTGLLKEKMGFKGVIVTDAIEMRALKDAYPDPEDLFVQLINAGVDVINGTNEPDIISIIENAVNKGRIPMERIDDACARVLDMKEKLGMFEAEPEGTREMRAEAIALTKDVNREIAPKFITWMSRRNNLVPVKESDIKKVHFIYIGYSKDTYARLAAAKEEFEAHGASVTMSEGIKNEEHIKQIAADNDLIVYFAHIGAHSPLGMPSFFEDKARWFLDVLTYGAEKSICVSTGSPFICFDWFPSAQNFVNLYCSEPETLKTFVKGLYGECEFTGKCPFNPNPIKGMLE